MSARWLLAVVFVSLARPAFSAPAALELEEDAQRPAVSNTIPASRPKKAPAPRKSQSSRKTAATTPRAPEGLDPDLDLDFDGSTTTALPDSESLTFDRALQLANARNTQVEALRAERRSLQNRQTQEIFRLVPDVSLVANYSIYQYRENGGLIAAGNVAVPTNNFAGIIARQAIWDGGNRWYSFQLAMAETDSAKLREDEVVFEVRSSLIPLFFNALLAEKVFESNQRFANSFARARQRMKKLLSAQVVGATDEQRIDGTYKSASLELDQSISRRENALTALANAAGIERVSTLKIAGSLAFEDKPIQFDTENIASPRVKRLRREAVIIRTRAGISEAQGQPQVNLFGSYGMQYSGFSSPTRQQQVGVIGMSVVIPITTAIATLVAGGTEQREALYRNSLETRDAQRDAQQRVASMQRQVELLRPTVARLAEERKASAANLAKFTTWMNSGDVSVEAWATTALQYHRLDRQYLELARDYWVAYETLRLYAAKD